MGVPIIYKGSLYRIGATVAIPVEPSGDAPLFSSAEIGTVDASTLAVTFDRDVSAADYSAGVTVKVNGSATSITSATRQANHAIVHYVIPVLWHGSGDVVTWEYSGGSIVAETGGAALADVTAQSATNNCEYAALLDLQADTLVLADNDPVSTWADQSGQGNDFTQTGDARPTKQTIGGYSAVVFDGVEDWMLGGNFADEPAAFAVMSIIRTTANSDGDSVLSKDAPTYQGWSYSIYGFGIDIHTDGGNIFSKFFNATVNVFFVLTGEIRSTTEGDFYKNGDNTGQFDGSSGSVTSYGNSANVIMGKLRQTSTSYTGFDCRAILLFVPNPSATNRAALEARLAARYGVTL